MSLIEAVYRQRVEFLRRDLSEPDMLLVPYDKKHKLLGEIWEAFHPDMRSLDNISLMGMRLIYVDCISEPIVALSASRLK